MQVLSRAAEVEVDRDSEKVPKLLHVHTGITPSTYTAACTPFGLHQHVL